MASRLRRKSTRFVWLLLSFVMTLTAAGWSVAGRMRGVEAASGGRLPRVGRSDTRGLRHDAPCRR